MYEKEKSKLILPSRLSGLKKEAMILPFLYWVCVPASDSSITPSASGVSAPTVHTIHEIRASPDACSEEEHVPTSAHEFPQPIIVGAATAQPDHHEVIVLHEPATETSAPSAPDEPSTETSAPSTPECQCPCCTNVHVPNQPKDLRNSGTQQSHASKDRKDGKTYTRTIQQAWYGRFPWITVCTSSFRIYCYVCRSAMKHELVTFTKHQQSTFVKDGFSNLKKALQRFQEHEHSEMHKEASLKLAAKSSKVDVAAQISQEHDKQAKEHREMLLKVLRCIRYLTRQGLAMRGHREDSESFEGNLYQLLLLQAVDSPRFGQWPKKRDYISPEITNKLVVLMGQSVLRDFLAKIRSCQFFSIIADEATDISHNEQMCLAVRWVDEEYQINESALGLFQLPDTKGLTIFSAIKDLLVRCNLPMGKCIGQAYDGAGNMSGIRNGVQALVKKECGNCLYVHCFAHSLNLCVQDAATQSEPLRNCLSFIFNLVQLIKFSPKRLHLFESLRKEAMVTATTEVASTPSLRTLCPTRWTVRHAAI